MDIQPTCATDERGHQERIGAAVYQHVDVASFARLSPGIRTEEPSVGAESLGSGTLDGAANAGQHASASSLGLLSLLRQFFLEMHPYGATEGAYEVGIWQPREHGHRMTPGITPGKTYETRNTEHGVARAGTGP